MLKKMVSIMLAMAMALSLAVPAFAETDVSPCAIGTFYEIENVEYVGTTNYGNKVELVRGSGNSSGKLYGEVNDSFSVQCSASLSGTLTESLEASLGFSITDEKTIVRGCEIDVPSGKKGVIFYQLRGEKYTADQVLYQMSTGVPKHELSRKTIYIYRPVSVDFSWKVY